MRTAVKFALTPALLGTLGLVTLLPRIYPTVVAGQSSVILMLGCAMATEMLFKPFVAALRMRSWYFVYDVIEIGTYTTFKFGLVLYCALVRGLDYKTLAFLTLCETVLRLSLVFVAAMIASPAVRKISPFGARRNMIRKIAGIGVAVSIMMVADIVLFQLDAGVIGWFMPESPGSIAVFGLGARLASIANQVIGVIGGVLIPRFSGFHETGDTEGTRKLLERGSKQIGLACVLVMGNLLVLGPHFLSLWLRKPWAPESGVILLILIPGYWMSLLTMPSKASLYGAAKLRGLTIFIVVEAIANFVISVALVRPLGIVGVALGTAIPLFGFHAILFPILLKKEVGVPVAEFWQMHKTSLAIGAVYLVLIGGLAFVPLGSLPRFFLFCAGTVSVFVALLLALVPEARSEVQKRLARFKRASNSAQAS